MNNKYIPQKPDHKRFQSTLLESKEAVNVIAKWMKVKGYSVSIPVLHIAPRHEDWKDYSDYGDLMVKKNGKVERIEVKRLSVEFTSKEDWPFGDEFIVCSKHSFDRAKPKPTAYFILNKSMTHAAVVSPSRRWAIKEQYDRRYDRHQQFYYAPMDIVRFYEIPLHE